MQREDGFLKGVCVYYFQMLAFLVPIVIPGSILSWQVTSTLATASTLICRWVNAYTASS